MTVWCVIHYDNANVAFRPLKTVSGKSGAQRLILNEDQQRYKLYVILLGVIG